MGFGLFIFCLKQNDNENSTKRFLAYPEGQGNGKMTFQNQYKSVNSKLHEIIHRSVVKYGEY